MLRRLTQENFDALLAFLPEFEREDFRFAETKAESIVMPAVEYTPTAMAFVETAYEHGWVHDFDWMSWVKEAERYSRDPDAVAGADLRTLRRLLTLHIRRDRFSGGHLFAMYESGHLTAILRRIRELRDGAGPKR